MTEFNQKEFAFTSSKGLKIKARFDGGTVSSDGGMMFVREADKRLRLTPRAAKCIDDPRQAGKVNPYRNPTGSTTRLRTGLRLRGCQ